MIARPRHLQAVAGLLRRHPIVALLGARQVGKTTLAKEVRRNHAGGVAAWFDLEDPDDLARLEEPKLALAAHRGLVVIDEVQRRPELFPVLRVLADRDGDPARFLLLGSASRDLLRQSSETLAGRIAYHEMDPLSTDEVGMAARDTLWLRGGFPRSYLAASLAASSEWRQSFVRTFLERDLPQLGVSVPSATMHRFFRMLAHYHGQVWNGSELARAFGIAATTVTRYLDHLRGGLVVRQVQPWHENLSKRQVRAPKVYLSDSGLLHTLLAIRTREELDSHPKVGASWEGFVLHEVATQLGASSEECYFWATHSGAELDLLVVRGQERRGFEVKRTTAPVATRSIRSAMESLRLDRVDVIHAGEHTFALADGIRAVAFARLRDDVERLA